MADERRLEVVWSPIAEDQAANMVARIRRANRGVAWRWSQSLLYRVNALSQRALRGLSVPELDRRVRIGEITHAPARVLYRVDLDQVVILSIRSARSARKPTHDHERDSHHHGE